jgi:hypothetical protein
MSPPQMLELKSPQIMPEIMQVNNQNRTGFASYNLLIVAPVY